MSLILHDDLRIFKFIVGKIMTNMYILTSDEELMIIDPGGEVEETLEILKTFNFKKIKVVLTHGHLDHVCSVHVLKEKFNAEVMIHKDDYEMLVGHNVHEEIGRVVPGYLSICTSFKPVEPNVMLSDNYIINFGKYEFRVIHTPGHTRGSCIIYCEDLNIAFTGDVIFRNGIGRVDTPHSNVKDMAKSIERILTTLKENTRIFPGHGEETTLLREINFLLQIVEELKRI